MSEHDKQTEPQTEPQSAEGELAADCIKAVEDYRGENISKWEAVSQISAALRSATVSTDIEQRSSAGSTLISTLLL